MPTNYLILLIALAIIVAMNPRIVSQLYNTVLGRIILLLFVVYFACLNLTLGLLAVFIIIIFSNQYTVYAEGMQTIGDDNVTPDTTVGQTVLTRAATKQEEKPGEPTLSELKSQPPLDGVDKEDIRDTIMSKSSKTLPIDTNAMKSTENVAAFSMPSVNNASLNEGFCPGALSFQM